MKTKIILSSCFLAFIGVFLYLYASRPSSDSLLAKLPDAPSAQYILDWEDDFKGNTLDTTKWSRVERHTAIPWRSYMTTDDRLYRHRNGYLRLYCIRNNGVIKNDTARVLTGGIWTRDKRAIGFGKVEVRARMTSAMGLWPAIWLTSHELGEDNPKHAEIDLLEHYNHDKHIFSTFHNYHTLHKQQEKSEYSFQHNVNVGRWNTYCVEILPDRLIMSVNDNIVAQYPKLRESRALGQFPYGTPSFLIIDMQWASNPWLKDLRPEELPAWMDIDWVKVYRLAGV